jgi:hypothetical protein
VKRYDGTAYIGVVGPEIGPINAYVSILNIKRREGDGQPSPIFATKGYEGRQTHVNRFLASAHDWLLLLDHDMIFAPDTLERLRAWGEPYVSGYYLRRRYAPMVPVWFEPYDGEWPLRWFLDIPERGKLHPIGASGWGCVLMHREVIEATRAILKGEDEVIEDDMDVWPYDLDAIERGDEWPRRLFRAGKPVGSDLRYPFYALQAGYQLMGDPDVRPAHLISYPLTPDDYEGAGGASAALREQHEKELAEARARVREGQVVVA